MIYNVRMMASATISATVEDIVANSENEARERANAYECDWKIFNINDITDVSVVSCRKEEWVININSIIEEIRNSCLYEYLVIKEILDADTVDASELIKKLSHMEQLWSASCMVSEKEKWKVLYHCALYQRMLMKVNHE